MSESTYDILWPEDSRSPETLLLQAESRISALEAALAQIDALDPEGMIDACSQAALRGLVLRMGEIARDARQARDATR